jgi:hypothetical protein
MNGILVSVLLGRRFTPSGRVDEERSWASGVQAHERSLVLSFERWKVHLREEKQGRRASNRGAAGVESVDAEDSVVQRRIRGFLVSSSHHRGGAQALLTVETARDVS